MVERMLERPVRHQGFAAQLAGLERAAGQLEARLQKAAGTPKDREVLRHIIGIERWGQRRNGLVVGGEAVSAEAVSDAHQAYKPAAESLWDALVEAFTGARANPGACARAE